MRLQWLLCMHMLLHLRVWGAEGGQCTSNRTDHEPIFSSPNHAESYHIMPFPTPWATYPSTGKECSEQLTTYYSLLTTHQSLLATYYLLLTTHYSLLTTGVLLTTYYLLLTTHYLLLTTYNLLLTTYYLLLTTYYLLLTTHYSLLTTHYLLLTTYYSLLTTYYLPLTTYYLLLTTYYSLLTTHYLLLTTYYSLLTTHYLLLYYSLLTTHYLLLATHYLLLTTYHSLLTTHYLLLTTTYYLLLATATGEECSEQLVDPTERRLDSLDDNTTSNTSFNSSNAEVFLTLAWLPPRYFHPALGQFSVNISGSARKQLDYFTQYDAASLLPSGSEVLANASLLSRLVPELWMATSHGWWVQARSTCSPQQWSLNRTENAYEVRVCDFAPAGADPVTFQLYLQVTLPRHFLDTS